MKTTKYNTDLSESTRFALVALYGSTVIMSVSGAACHINGAEMNTQADSIVDTFGSRAIGQTDPGVIERRVSAESFHNRGNEMLLFAGALMFAGTATYVTQKAPREP